MNLSVVSRAALKAVAIESFENRLHICGKIIRDFEKQPNECSHRVCNELRAVLKSVQKSATASADEVTQAGALLLRLKPIDPRRARCIKKSTQAAIEEPMAIVPGTSASEVPKSTLTIDGIQQIIRRVIGTFSYEAMPDLIGLSTEKQNLIIEGIVHGCELSLSVPEIQSIIDQLKRLKANTSFPGLIQIAERYRQVTEELLDRFNGAGVTQ